MITPAQRALNALFYAPALLGLALALLGHPWPGLALGAGGTLAYALGLEAHNALRLRARRARAALRRAAERGSDRADQYAGGVAMDVRDYGYHQPSDDEPWWSVVTERQGARYQRAIALSRWRRELDAPPGPLPAARTRERRRRCVEHWRAYLETGEVAGG